MPVLVKMMLHSTIIIKIMIITVLYCTISHFVLRTSDSIAFLHEPNYGLFLIKSEFARSFHLQENMQLMMIMNQLTCDNFLSHL